jgi:hypothetical protein
MSSFFSSTNNYSLYALPAAWLLSIAPHFYAVTSFNNLQKKLKTGAEWDNSKCVLGLPFSRPPFSQCSSNQSGSGSRWTS